MPTTAVGGAPPASNPQPIQSPTAAIAPSLARLPPELIIAIFGQLCAHCQDPTCEHEPDDPNEVQENLAALSAASKTCKWMQTLVQPILFHQFTALSNPVHPAQLYWFVRTLCERPDLANAVQMISLDHGRWFELDRCGDHPSQVVVVRETDTRRIVTAAERLGLDARLLDLVSLEDCDIDSVYNPWEWEVGDGCIVFETIGATFLAWVAIRLCPSLWAVNVGEFMEFFSLWFLHRSAESRIGFIRLHALYYIGWHVLGFNMHYLSDLMRLTPKLRALQLFFARLHDPGNEAGGPQSPASSPKSLDLGSLTRLDLVLCSLSRNRLREILRNCANLSDFTCITMNHDLTQGITRIHDPPTSSKGVAIQPHELTSILQHDCPHLRKTLRRLTLEHLRPFGYSYDQGYSAIDNLEAVEELYLGANGMFNEHQADSDSVIRQLSQMIPPNTVVLSIFEARVWPKEVSEALIHLLEDIRTGRASLRKLKEIHVSFRPLSAWVKYKYKPTTDDDEGFEEDGKDWWFGDWPHIDLQREVWKAADAAGVTVRIRKESLPPALEKLAFFRAPSPDEEEELE
jgi:hypothetical protein